MPKVYNERIDKYIPDSAVYIGRPSKWGNPFRIGDGYGREGAVEAFRKFMESHPDKCNEARWELKGKDLVCWCSPLPCHGDILLKIANEKAKMEEDIEIDMDVVIDVVEAQADVWAESEGLDHRL